MVIKAATRQKRPKISGKKPFGTIYKLAREGLKYYGYYDKYNLRQYDPQVYVDKYTYKPHKRLVGYAGLSKRIRKKARSKVSKYYQFYQKRDFRSPWYYKYPGSKYYSKSSYISFTYGSNDY